MTTPGTPGPHDAARDRHFRTDHLHKGLRGRSVRGGLVTLSTQTVGFLIKLGSLAALARLVTKEEFGLIFAVTAITALIGQVKDFGLSAATQQRSTLNHEQVTALFWINVAMSVVAMGLTAAITPAVVWLYQGDPRLLWIMLAYAAMSPFDGLAVQHQALLKRQMQFTAVGVIDTTALLASRTAAIALAWYGAGYWALVAQAAMLRVVKVCGVWLACTWRPARPTWDASIRPLLAFGRNLTGVRLLSELSTNVDKVLLLRFAGEASTGIYGNAYRLLQLPVRNITWPLSSVALPVLSRLQDQPERFRVYWRRATALLVTVQLPLVLFMFVAAEPLILTILGPQWTDAAVIFRVLAPAAMIATLTPGLGWVFAALGRTDRQVRWVTASSLLRGAAIVVGVQWGAIGVAAAASISELCLRPPAVAYCFRASPLRFGDLVLAVWRPLVTSVAASVAVIVAEGNVLAPSPVAVRLVLDAVIFVVAYGACWLVVPGGRDALRETALLVRQLRAKGRHGESDQVATVTDERLAPSPQEPGPPAGAQIASGT